MPTGPRASASGRQASSSAPRVRGPAPAAAADAGTLDAILGGIGQTGRRTATQKEINARGAAVILGRGTARRPHRRPQAMQAEALHSEGGPQAMQAAALHGSEGQRQQAAADARTLDAILGGGSARRPQAMQAEALHSEGGPRASSGGGMCFCRAGGT